MYGNWDYLFVNVSDAETLKQLETRAKKLQVERDTASDELMEAQARLTATDGKLLSVRGEIDRLKARAKIPVVTEHAMLRYLERTNGLDREEITKAILLPETIEQIRTLGSGKYPIGNGLKAVVKGNTVVSIIGRVSD